MITNSGFNLLNKFLTYDPKKRITAEEALTHSFFEVNIHVHVHVATIIEFCLMYIRLYI